MKHLPGFPWPLSFIFLFILTATRVPSLAGWIGLNRAAVQVAAVCTGAETAPPDLPTGGRQALYLAGGLAYCEGREAQAQQRWGQMLAQTPARLDAVRTAWPTDASLARLAVERYPDVATAHFWLGDALREQEDAAGAIAVYERGLGLAPDTALVWDQVGRLYEEAGDLDKAVHAYDQACFYVDRGKNGCLRAGRLYLQMEMYEAAADRYRTSLQQLPGHTGAHRGSAEALLALGRTEEAILHLRALAAQGDTEAQQKLQALTD
jgi:tetratricopeptide (TPR) repeat protein